MNATLKAVLDAVVEAGLAEVRPASGYSSKSELKLTTVGEALIEDYAKESFSSSERFIVKGIQEATL